LNTPTVGFCRFTAAACATAITAIGAWAFVKASASTERDPFQFAAVMAANAEVVRTAQVQARNVARACRNGSRSSDLPVSSQNPVCENG
jgi:hypothetical protein